MRTMSETAAVSVGQEAPDFALKDQHGQVVRLSSFRGKKAVLIVFYPWAFSSVCGGELQQLRDQRDALLGDEVELLAISCDAMFSLRVYADQENFTYSLLSDFWPHGEVAKAYGVFSDEVGISLRGTFLVDTDGIVRWSVLHGIPDARDVEDYRTAIATL